MRDLPRPAHQPKRASILVASLEPVARADPAASAAGAARAVTLRQDPAFGIFASRIAPGSTVLDIGAGFGTVGAFLAERGAVVDGIEPDPERASVAEGCLRNIVCTTLDDASGADGLSDAYDVVLLIDVLEHLVDPVEGLRQAAAFLAPEGRLFLFLPNSAHWKFRLKILRGDWRYHDWGLFDRTHLRFFDLRTAAKLPRQAGLEVVDRWLTDHHGSKFAKLGIALRPNLFAFHVLYELRRT